MLTMRNGLSLIVGLLFGVGLCLSDMNEPSKVLGFLDLAGTWDPSLALVMVGAIAVAAPAFALARRRGVDWSGNKIDLPTGRKIDAPLALGALIFGVGWGLGGLCPGPGIVNLGFLSVGAAIFVAGVAAGALAYRAVGLRLQTPRALTQDA
jgi:uncharacterized membrane protein YedE/YeeE